MTLLEKIGNALTSGEVFAVLFAALGGWGISVITNSKKKRAEERAELGRLKFKLENQEATRQAIREELASLRTQLQPMLAGLENEITELRHWVREVDNRADQALKMAGILERTQAQWVARAETVIGVCLSAENPAIARNLLRDKPEEK